jgi:hypothetical protein
MGREQKHELMPVVRDPSTIPPILLAYGTDCAPKETQPGFIIAAPPHRLHGRTEGVGVCRRRLTQVGNCLFEMAVVDHVEERTDHRGLWLAAIERLARHLKRSLWRDGGSERDAVSEQDVAISCGQRRDQRERAVEHGLSFVSIDSCQDARDVEKGGGFDGWSGLLGFLASVHQDILRHTGSIEDGQDRCLSRIAATRRFIGLFQNGAFFA